MYMSARCLAACKSSIARNNHVPRRTEVKACRSSAVPAVPKQHCRNQKYSRPLHPGWTRLGAFNTADMPHGSENADPIWLIPFHETTHGALITAMCLPHTCQESGAN